MNYKKNREATAAAIQMEEQAAKDAKAINNRTAKKKPETEQISPDGIVGFAPNGKAPEFVKAEIIISPEKFYSWLELNEKLLHDSEKYGKQLKLTLKQSQKGNFYFSVNTYGL